MTDEGHAPTIPETEVAARTAPLPARSPDPRYSLRQLLGKGGMGEVWLAHDERVDRDIAIKLMRAGANNADQVARFLREARVQGRLEHPSIVPVHDLASDEAEAPFFAMKRLAGTTLADVLASGDATKWPRRTVLQRFVDVCLAVEFANQRGVVHRDLKPANIMLGDFGEAYVLDWGIARLTGDSEAPGAIRQTDLPNSSASQQTAAGAMLGTPGYMSPEQMRGGDIDPRTDVYALGCILFEILTGTPANPRDTAIEHTLSTLEHRPSTRASEIPPELDDTCARATAADRASRLGSVRELADRVQRFLDGDRDLARRRELAAAHVARAVEHVARGDAGRSEALREASSAIALDVDNAEARTIITRLLVEPPAAVPPAAQLAIENHRRDAGVVVLKWAVVAYVAFLLTIPGIWLLGVAETWPLVVVEVEVALSMVFCVQSIRLHAPLGVRRAVFGAGLHCLVIATIGIVLGSLLVVPILVFGSATILFVAPTVRIPKAVFVMHLLAIAIPLALELLGFVPRTFTLIDGGLVLHPWALHMSPSAMVVSILGTVVLQLAGNMLVLDRTRLAQSQAEEAVFIQKWQLEQMLPSSGSK
jgi:serine/threonine-protein kinase